MPVARLEHPQRAGGSTPLRHGDPGGADGFVRGAAGRAGDAADRHGKVRATGGQRTLGHLAHDRFAHRTVDFQIRRGHA